MSGRSAAACAEERERENKGARPLPPGRPADPPLALVAAGGHHQPPLQVLQRGVAGSAAAAGHVCRRKARARGHSCRVPLASRVCLLAPSLCLGLWQLPREVLPAGAGWGLGGARCVYGSVRVRHTWPCRLRCGAACGAAGASWAAAASTRRKQHVGWLAGLWCTAPQRCAPPRSRGAGAPAAPHGLPSPPPVGAGRAGGAGGAGGAASGGGRRRRRRRRLGRRRYARRAPAATRRPGPGPPPRGRQLTNPNALHCEAGRSRPTRRVPRGGWLCPRLRC